MPHAPESQLQSWAARIEEQYKDAGLSVSEDKNILPNHADGVKLLAPYSVTVPAIGQVEERQATFNADIFVYTDADGSIGIQGIVQHSDQVFSPMWEHVESTLQTYLENCRKQGIAVDMRAFPTLEDDLMAWGINLAQAIPDYQTRRDLQLFQSHDTQSSPASTPDLALGWTGEPAELEQLFSMIPAEFYPEQIRTESEAWRYMVERLCTDATIQIAQNIQLLWDYKEWFYATGRFEITYETMQAAYEHGEWFDPHEYIGLAMEETPWYDEHIAKPALEKLAATSHVARWLLENDVFRARMADPIIRDPDITGLFIIKQQYKDIFVLEYDGDALLQLDRNFRDDFEDAVLRRAYCNGWRYWCQQVGFDPGEVGLWPGSLIFEEETVHLGMNLQTVELNTAITSLNEAEKQEFTYHTWFTAEVLPWLTQNPASIDNWWEM